jgi:hypothetical protein
MEQYDSSTNTEAVSTSNASREQNITSKSQSILQVKPILKRGKGLIKPLGHQLFPQLASSIYISAGTKSGKTTVISHILDHCIDKETKVFIFAPTVFIDATYAHIIKQLTKRGIQHREYTHFIDADGVNILDLIVDQLVNNSVKPTTTDQPKILSHRIVNGVIVREYEEEPPLTPQKNKQEKHAGLRGAPEYMFIFDDLGEEMRHKSIYKWLLKQRQFHAKTIISTQSINNLMPNSIGQLDYILVFGGQREEAVEALRRKLDLPIDENEFLDLYHQATDEKYNFLYIDRREVVLKKNFEDILFSKG